MQARLIGLLSLVTAARCEDVRPLGPTASRLLELEDFTLPPALELAQRFESSNLSEVKDGMLVFIYNVANRFSKLGLNRRGDCEFVSGDVKDNQIWRLEEDLTREGVFFLINFAASKSSKTIRYTFNAGGYCEDGNLHDENLWEFKKTPTPEGFWTINNYSHSDCRMGMAHGPRDGLCITANFGISEAISGQECVFPFKYKGTTYNSCADVGGSYGANGWCAFDADYKSGRWGSCPNNSADICATFECRCSSEYNIMENNNNFVGKVEDRCQHYDSDDDKWCYLAGGMAAATCPGARKSSRGNFYYTHDAGVCQRAEDARNDYCGDNESPNEWFRILPAFDTSALWQNVDDWDNRSDQTVEHTFKWTEGFSESITRTLAKEDSAEVALSIGLEAAIEGLGLSVSESLTVSQSFTESYEKTSEHNQTVESSNSFPVPPHTRVCIKQLKINNVDNSNGIGFVFSSALHRIEQGDACN